MQGKVLCYSHVGTSNFVTIASERDTKCLIDVGPPYSRLAEIVSEPVQ